VSGSAVLLLNTFVFQSNTSTPIEDNTSYQEVVARDWMTPFNSIDNLFLSLIPLLFGLIVIFFYIPTRSSLGLSKKEGKKEILLNKFKLPERGYSIPYGKIKIRLTRKIFSLKGLIGHEVLFSIQLPKDFPEKKRIFDFLTCEDMYHTSAYTIMHKTVKIRNIPMIITRTRALLSMLSSRAES
jgi:hypothetical protein